MAMCDHDPFLAVVACDQILNPLEQNSELGDRDWHDSRLGLVGSLVQATNLHEVGTVPWTISSHPLHFRNNPLPDLYTLPLL